MESAAARAGVPVVVLSSLHTANGDGASPQVMEGGMLCDIVLSFYGLMDFSSEAVGQFEIRITVLSPAIGV